ncbi:hypothetical protein KC19_VG257200 [Ceratodon purpureus]|uniref:Secreted protein n=1 Tax=Ceratodon purpureus TaxID=3225 RepID=A0A8T0HTL5_CERPU|nr:hypothetical protein KC19_VG257200 [Ceratodon purpureus]
MWWSGHVLHLCGSGPLSTLGWVTVSRPASWAWRMLKAAPSYFPKNVRNDVAELVARNHGPGHGADLGVCAMRDTNAS